VGARARSSSPEIWHAPLQALSKSHALLLQDDGCVERTAGSDRASVPLAVSEPLPSSQPSVGSRNPPQLPSPLTLPQLRMLFQSTHEKCQGADASAEPDERTTTSPLQRTLTAQIMGLWAKHNGAVEHIGVKRPVEMLEIQRAQCFTACPPNPDTSVFAELFTASLPAASQSNARSEKEKQMHMNWNPLAFLLDFSAQRLLTRLPPDVWQAFFCRSFGAPIPKMLAHAQGRTKCSCKMCVDPLGDHVLCCKQHTGSIRSHNHLMDVLAMLARASNIGPVRVNHKVSTTGDGTRKQGDVQIQNFPLSRCNSLVIDVSFVCEFTGSSRALGDGITLCATLMTS